MEKITQQNGIEQCTGGAALETTEVSEPQLTQGNNGIDPELFLVHGVTWGHESEAAPFIVIVNRLTTMIEDSP